MLSRRFDFAAAIAAVGVCVLLYSPCFAQAQRAEKTLLDAVTRGDASLVERLLSEGLDTNSADATGMSALMHAASRGDLLVLGLLIDHGAHVNSRDSRGRTPLMHAAAQNRASTADSLLARGADRTIRDTANQTAEDIARSRGATTTVLALSGRPAWAPVLPWIATCAALVIGGVIVVILAVRTVGWAQNVLLVGVAGLSGLFLIEMILRILGIAYPVLYGPDSARGIAHYPNVAGWYSREGKGYVRINSDGLRDGEHAIPKPPKTVRIAVLGDSFADAVEVSQENTFWEVAERHMAECYAVQGFRVEFVNFGVAGYGTAQELITLRRHVWRYDPDIVLLVFFPLNDVTDNSRLLANAPEKPYFTIAGDDLVLDDAFSRYGYYAGEQGAWLDIKNRIINHARILQVANEARQGWKSLFGQRRADTLTDPLMDPNNLVFSPPENATWRQAWDVTERLISTINDEVSTRGALFVVTTASVPVQVHPQISRREELQSKLGVGHLFYPNHRLAALAERESFLIIPTAQALVAHVDSTGDFLHGFPNRSYGNGHWNTKGHRIAGEFIGEALCSATSSVAGQNHERDTPLVTIPVIR